MDYMLAINDKQLGICLRMLYAEGLQGIVTTVRNDKGKIEFHIRVNADERTRATLAERYEILIS